MYLAIPTNTAPVITVSLYYGVHKQIKESPCAKND